MTENRRNLQRQAAYFPYVAGCLVIAGIVHLVSVLAMPALASKDAFARISALAGLNQITIIPRFQPGAELFPFFDPAMALGVCRYDLAAAPLRLSVGVANDSLLLISFHDRFGRVYYAMTDRAAVRGRIEAVIVTQKQLEELEARDSDDDLQQDLRLVTQQREGYVLFQALAEQEGDHAAASRLVGAANCRSDLP